MQLLKFIGGDDLLALRDRALLSPPCGITLAARRAKLMTLEVTDLPLKRKGLWVTIRWF